VEVVKNIFIEAHEELIAEYLDAHPSATEQEAYDLTVDAAHERMTDILSERIDAAHDRMKDGE
jgi:hypothetical protein